jgi:hypothetical protein
MSTPGGAKVADAIAGGAVALVGPALVLDAEACWRLVHDRGHRDIARAIERLAAQHEAEVAWRQALVPAAKVAAALGITEDAMRKRLRRGSWAGELVARRWWAMPPPAPEGATSRA